MIKKGSISFFICLILAGCGSQKTIKSHQNNCSIIIASEEDLAANYKMFFTSTSAFNTKQLTDFDKIENGVLFYKGQEQLRKGTFLIVDFDNDFIASKKMEGFNNNVNFSLKDKDQLKHIIEGLKKESYYQNCVVNDGHALMYLLVIRYNNEKIVQYYSPFHSPYGIKATDCSIKSIQELIGILDQNYYK